MKKWLDRYDKGGSVKKLKPSEIADIKKFIANNADTEDINDPRYYTGKPVVNKAYNVTNRLSAGNLPRYVDPNVKNDPALKWVNAASMLGPIGIIAAPEIAAGAAALSPYLSAPLVVGGTELAAVTPASVAGAYFAHEGYKKLPQTQASVLNAYNNPTRQNILNAANDVGWNTMDFLGTGEAIKGATQLAEPIINKAGKTVVDKLSRLPFNNVPLLNQASKFNPWAFKTKPSVQELIPDVTYGTDELGSFRRVGNRKEYILSDYSESSMYEPTLTEPAYNSYMDLLNSHNGMIPSKKEEAFFRDLSVNRGNLNQDWDLIHSLNNNENYGQYLSRGRFTHQRYNAPSSFEELYNAQPSKPQKVIKKYLNDLDKKFGSFIPVKKAASYNSQELEDLINEKLRNGMGIKKINDPVQVKLLNHGNNLNRLDFQTIINNQHTGNIGLNRNVDPYIPGRMSFTDRIFPNRNGVNAWVNSEGFRKAGDFPFNSTTRASELYHSGMSGEINSAINEALKEKGLGNILSGGTGHTDMGKGRWQNLVNKGVAEDFGFDPRTNQNYYKLKKEGGDITDYNFPAWQLADPIRASYHVVNPKDFHGPDQYKYPNHMTFSDESMYSTPEHMGGHWTELKNGKWQFQPSQWNIQNAGGKEKFLKWWNEGEGKEGNIVKFGNGGYVVKRSHDRKGKTHVVIGPDGTKKYFGDSKMGQHPNDPARKKAFYARHKHNLEHNPYFRAFARATWADGGEIHNWREVEVPHTKNQLSGWLDKL